MIEPLEVKRYEEGPQKGMVYLVLMQVDKLTIPFVWDWEEDEIRELGRELGERIVDIDQTWVHPELYKRACCQVYKIFRDSHKEAESRSKYKQLELF